MHSCFSAPMEEQQLHKLIGIDTELHQGTESLGIKIVSSVILSVVKSNINSSFVK